MAIWRICPSLRSCPFFLFNNDSFICLSGQNIFIFSGSPSRIFIESLFIPWRLHSGNKICFFSSSGLCKLIHNRLLIWSLTKFIWLPQSGILGNRLRSLQVPLQCSSFYSLSLSSLFLTIFSVSYHDYKIANLCHSIFNKGVSSIVRVKVKSLQPQT